MTSLKYPSSIKFKNIPFEGTIFDEQFSDYHLIKLYYKSISIAYLSRQDFGGETSSFHYKKGKCEHKIRYSNEQFNDTFVPT